MRPRCVGGVQTTQTLPHRPDRRPSCLLNRARFGRLCVPPGRQRDRAWPRGTHSPGGLRRGAGDAATCLISADIGPLRGHSPRRAISPRCVVPTSDLRRNLVPEVADTSTPACGVQSERGVGRGPGPKHGRPSRFRIGPLRRRYDHCCTTGTTTVLCVPTTTPIPSTRRAARPPLRAAHSTAGW